MFKKALIAGAALTMLSGAAFAQVLATEVTTTTTSPLVALPAAPLPAPLAGTVSESHSQTAVNALGQETTKSQSYRADGNKVEANSSTTVHNPDGSTATTSRNQTTTTTVLPRVNSSTTTTTTTIP